MREIIFLQAAIVYGKLLISAGKTFPITVVGSIIMGQAKPSLTVHVLGESVLRV